MWWVCLSFCGVGKGKEWYFSQGEGTEDLRGLYIPFPISQRAGYVVVSDPIAGLRGGADKGIGKKRTR